MSTSVDNADPTNYFAAVALGGLEGMKVVPNLRSHSPGMRAHIATRLGGVLSFSGRHHHRERDALGDWMLVCHGLSEPLRAPWSRPNSPLTAPAKRVGGAVCHFKSA
jgi:hypothetical protein